MQTLPKKEKKAVKEGLSWSTVVRRAKKKTKESRTPKEKRIREVAISRLNKKKEEKKTGLLRWSYQPRGKITQTW